MNWKELSDTTKAIVYLAGLVVAGAAGGFASRPFIDGVLSAGTDVATLELELEALRTELELHYAKKSEVPLVDLSSFVQYNELFHLKSEHSDWTLQTRGDGVLFVRSDFPLQDDFDQWSLVRRVP